MNQEQRKRELRAALEHARGKTLRLLDRVPDALLRERVHDFYSPIGWHFGHIAMTEEYWALNQALGRPPQDPDFTFLFANIPENPKDNRVHLPDRTCILAYMAETRKQVLAALDQTNLDTDDPMIAGGYAWDFAHQHECQHQETIVELMQLLCMRASKRALSVTEAALALETVPDTDMVEVHAGAFRMGSDDRHGYDNEQRAHDVEVAPFRLDRTPVTTGQWVRFIEDGGYRRPELWTAEGWKWRAHESAELPEYWFRCGTGYGYHGWLGTRPIHPLEPVSSVSWYEADAYARWIGKRLPTEAEWEYAASCDPATQRARRYPWGDHITGADLSDCDLRGPGPMPVNASSAVSIPGPVGMAGGVWEWTSSRFLPYPGFAAYPYDGYSKDHMDGSGYVCRGGSWATDPRILRCSFRNWYVPAYRQGLLGLRCAAESAHRP